MMRNQHVMITAVEPEDLAQVVMWRNDPDTYSGFIEYDPLGTDAQRRFMDSLATDASRRLWMISVPGDAGQPPYEAVTPAPGAIPVGMVGLIGVDMRNRHCELGPIFIGSLAHRGQGIAGQAEQLVLRHCFEHLGMHKVTSQVIAGNVAGLSLQRSCGMKDEGVLRGHVFRHGEFIDLHLLAIFAADWAKSTLHQDA